MTSTYSSFRCTAFIQHRFLFLALMLLVAINLFADPIAHQGFENSPADTWNYSASPASTVPYFWGRTNQVLGGTSAQNGSWYWASWLMESNECSVTFANVALTSGIQHFISLYYYARNLQSGTDAFQICLEYDEGTQWENWVSFPNNHTDDWSLFSCDLPIGSSTVRLKIKVQYANPYADKYAHWDNISISEGSAAYSAPFVYHATIAQRTDGSKLVDIHYDLFDGNGDLCEVSLSLSDNAGTSFEITPSAQFLTGDIGGNIVPGVGKHIIWDAGAESVNFDGSQFQAKFTADDGTLIMPPSFIFVQGGTIYPTYGIFTTGLTVESFIMDKYELTNAEWNAVMGSGPVDSYPHSGVSWYGAIEYCNRRSLQEGLTPCYSYLDYGTDPDDWPAVLNHNSVDCNWSAEGYRLLSEAEWEYVARGGLETHDYIYSGSNNLLEVGWYNSNSGGAAQPVGQLASNEIGTFDLSGNLWEWCWDLHSWDLRVLRGGSFVNGAIDCTVWNRPPYGVPSGSNQYIGFRICRNSP